LCGWLWGHLRKVDGRLFNFRNLMYWRLWLRFGDWNLMVDWNYWRRNKFFLFLLFWWLLRSLVLGFFGFYFHRGRAEISLLLRSRLRPLVDALVVEVVRLLSWRVIVFRRLLRYWLLLWRGKRLRVYW